MTAPTLEVRPTHRFLPLLGSEVLRIWHRRLLRVLALLFLAGITVVSMLVFANSRSTAGSTFEELAANRQEQQQYWEECAAQGTPERVERRCGPEPATQPVESFDYGEDKLYRAKENLPVVVLAVVIAAAGVAFIVGASSGGAEWSSRSMTLQLLWEPRRLRLLLTKWLALLIVMVSLAFLATALALGLAALTASMRGTWTGSLPSEFGSHSLAESLGLMTLRGLALVAVAATIGYAIAILVRNTGASLGVAFVYFVLVENAARIALLRYGSEPFMLSTNSIAFLIPEGLDVPGRRVSPAEVDPRADFFENVPVHLTNLRAFITMLVYTALLAIPAAWSFSRRDVG